MQRLAIFLPALTLAPLLRAQDPPPAKPPTIEERLQALEQKLQAGEKERADLKAALDKRAEQDKTPKWYDKLSIRGYAHVRYTELWNRDPGAQLWVPNDRTAVDAETIYLRRGRVVLSGDVTDRLFFYAQMDFAGLNSTANQEYIVSMRDYYGDYALDGDKEYRLRFGETKVPFGWSNMQSSQNRIALERPDAINSAVEGERDLGAYLMWAPKAIRERFRNLVRNGLRGSGDYGVLTFGCYSGQGLNRTDLNNQMHWIARAAYPFELANKQMFELGVYGYTGRFVASTGALTGVGTPTQRDTGSQDSRAGVTAVWYPQPFGLEAEWNWGQSPTLSHDFTRIEHESVQGGYVQAVWRFLGEKTTVLPFVRWNFFDGARKFARNAPRDNVNEIDVGVRYVPTPEFELTLQYTHTYYRTDTTTFVNSSTGYAVANDVDRFGIQVQWNF